MASKPKPIVDNWSRAFWDAAARGELILQRCGTTGRFWYPPGPVSPFAINAPWTWEACSGKGVVESWVVFHRAYFAGFGDDLPYNVASIRLDEGPLMLSNILAPNAAIEIGARVEVAFTPRDDFMIPQFRLSGRPA